MSTVENEYPTLDTPFDEVMYEVGIAHEGCRLRDASQRDLQRKALGTLLADLGDDAKDWSLQPHIRERHLCSGPAEVFSPDFGRKYLAEDRPCSWAAYGIRREGKPGKHYVAEGTLLCPGTHPL